MAQQLVLTPDALDRARDLLLQGGIVVFPTDTVYGVGALPSLPDAVARLFVAKNRPEDKAIPYLIADVADLDRVGIDITAAARRLAERFWPGGLTIVVERRELRGDLPPTVAVRLPALPLARDLIRAAGGVLAVTSANISGGSNCSTAEEVLAQLAGRVDAVIDGGRCPGGTESTVVDATAEAVRVLRVGAVSPAALAEIVELVP